MITISKIIIRKSDAISSVVFFLFSSFLLPRNITRISLKKLLYLMKSFDKNETAIRMGLSRAVKAGILKNIREGDRVFYEIQENGQKNIEEWKELKQSFWKKISLRKNGWNGYWCIVIEDIPGNMEERIRFVEYIKKLGFGRLGRGCYIHPYDLSKDVESAAEELNLTKYTKVFISRLASFYNIHDLVREIWDIEDVKRKYMEFTVQYPLALSPWNSMEDKLVAFCHNFIHEFTEIMKADPVLPTEMLGPNWEGDNALRLLDQFNKTIVPKTKDYVERIMGQPD